MLRKSPFIRIADKYLMAPYPIMDRDGGDAYRDQGSFKVRAARQILNTLNMPETKVMALVLAFASASIALDGKEQNPLKPVASIFAMAAFFTAARKFANDAYFTAEEEKNAPIYYLNPNPTAEPTPLQDDVELDVLRREFGAKAGFGRAALISAGFAAFGYYSVGEPAVGLVGGFLTLTPAVNYYRARRVLNGDWEVLDAEPEVTEERKKLELSLQPI